MIADIACVLILIGAGSFAGILLHAVRRRSDRQAANITVARSKSCEIDHCEICGDMPNVTICEHDVQTGAQWTIVLCDDCFDDRLALLEHKPVDW